MSVLEAAQSDDEVVALRALRDKLAEQMDVATPGVAAGLANQLQAVLQRLSSLDRAGKVTIDDALAERRVARSSRAVDPASAAGKAKRAS